MSQLESGCEVLPILTNLRDFSDRVVDWVRIYHGAALASVGLAVPGAFPTLTIAATTTYDRLYPLGSHPLLDPLWSTESLSFIHDGCEADRFVDKIALISQSPLALATLRVCASDHDEAVYNCGMCRKCLMTMIGLHLVDKLEACQTLPSSFDLEALRMLPIVGPVTEAGVHYFLRALGDSGKDRAIKNALHGALRRQMAEPSVAPAVPAAP